MLYKTGVLKKMAICERKHLCLSLFLINFVTKIEHRCFYYKMNSFFMEHLRWLLLQVLYKKMFRKIQQTPLERFVQFCENRGSGKVFCCEFCEISQNNFMQNNFERLLLDVKRCYQISPYDRCKVSIAFCHRHL